MKKSLLYLAAAFLTLTACTSEEVIDVNRNQSNAIRFENVVNKSSRAADGDLSNANYDHFLVYGYYTEPDQTTPVQIFNGDDVIKKNINDKISWEYDGVRYWKPGCTYHFYAYSCADVELSNIFGNLSFNISDVNNTSDDSHPLRILSYVCDRNHQHDLVFAGNENIVADENSTPSVKLNFSHALSKIKAIFTTDFPTGFMVYVSNIYVTDFYNRADFNVSSSTWSNYTGEENNTQSVMLSVPDNSFVENKTGSKITSSEAFVIPKFYDATGSENVRLHFTINVMMDDEIIMERKIVGTWSPQWEKSKIYTYNIKITGTSAGILPIVFSDVQDLYGAESWEDSRPLDMMFGIETN